MKIQIKEFRELTTNELYDILRVRSEVFVVEQTCVYLDCDGKDKSAYHVFAYEDGEVAAYTRILNRGVSYDEVSIGRVLVNEKHRGKKYGYEIMKKTMEFISENMKESEIRISAQKYLLNFYISLGFEAVSEVYLEDDIEHLEMFYKK